MSRDEPEVSDYYEELMDKAELRGPELWWEIESMEISPYAWPVRDWGVSAITHVAGRPDLNGPAINLCYGYGARVDGEEWQFAFDREDAESLMVDTATRLDAERSKQ